MLIPDEIIDNSTQAMTIMGVKKEDGTFASQDEMLSKITTILDTNQKGKEKPSQSDSESGKEQAAQSESEIDKLAKLDPLAVFNMFKGYKNISGRSWSKLYDEAAKLSVKMHNPPPKEMVIDKNAEKLEKRNFQVLASNLSNNFEITKKDKESTEKNLLELNKCNQQLEKINSRIKEIMVKGESATPKERKELEKILCSKIELLNKKREYDIKQSESTEGFDKEKAETVNYYLRLASRRIDQDKEKYDTRYAEMTQTYDNKLLLSDENLAENRAYVVRLLENIKRQGAVKSEESKKKQSEQIAYRMKSTEDKKITEIRLQKSIFGGFSGENNAKTEMDSRKKMYDDVIKAHDDYLDKAQAFQRHYIKAEDMYNEIHGLKFNEAQSGDVASAHNRILSMNLTNIKSTKTDIESAAITEQGIKELNTLIEKANKV